MEKEEPTEKITVRSTVVHEPENLSVSSTQQWGMRVPTAEEGNDSPVPEVLEENKSDNKIDGQEKESLSEEHALDYMAKEENTDDIFDYTKQEHEKENVSDETNSKFPHDNAMQKDEEAKPVNGSGLLSISSEASGGGTETSPRSLNDKKVEVAEGQGERVGRIRSLGEMLYEEDGEDLEMEANRSLSTSSSDNESEIQGYAWPERAVAVTNFVREKSVVAVSKVLRRLSGKSIDNPDDPDAKDSIRNSKEVASSSQESEAIKISANNVGYGWNPLSFIRISLEGDLEKKAEAEYLSELIEPIAMKGRIILYTRLGCQDCKEARLFLHKKRLRYIEINIDAYPGRKIELEKVSGSSAVPRVLFNEVLIGGLNELKSLDESGKLVEKIEYVVNETPSFEAPLPPFSGEDDMFSSGAIDELALVVQKMKDHIVVKDRFHRMRRFVNCFVGSEAVDFLSEDQYLEREEAVEFGRKLASKLFFQNIFDENVFEDGNHLYRFLDDDPLIAQCQNIPRGIIEVKPKPIIEISSRLRFLFYAILEAYASEDGKHVDYRSIHGSEEFARYLRMAEELQRVELQDMPREEKLAFFINLYNLMAIHAILVWGHPSGPLERRKLFGDFKYVIGGCIFSLSVIHSGVLRANQRPPYNFIKPFGVGDKRLKVSLPHPEPLVHFALANGSRSGPALQCYSPTNIDKELTEAARRFLRNGGLFIDFNAKIVYASKLLRWFGSDFGTNEDEVFKYAANYLKPEESKAFLELLPNTQLKVVYQPFDWGLNN